MSLGCGQLSDDQLFQLTQEICGEWVKRDPIVRKAAQAEIYSAAEKLEVMRSSIARAIGEFKAAYEKRIFEECRVAVTEGVGSGEIKLFTPQQEATFIANATIKARERIAEQVVEEAQLFIGERLPEYARLELISVVIQRLAQQSMNPSRSAVAREIWQRAEEERRKAQAAPYFVQPNYDQMLTMTPEQYMEWKAREKQRTQIPNPFQFRPWPGDPYPGW